MTANFVVVLFANTKNNIFSFSFIMYSSTHSSSHSSIFDVVMKNLLTYFATMLLYTHLLCTIIPKSRCFAALLRL